MSSREILHYSNIYLCSTTHSCSLFELNTFSVFVLLYQFQLPHIFMVLEVGKIQYTY